uniref:Uncharacterized protein n=1 Tax=Arundo donax TaxID=35708 RepID=A0A0A9EAA6_ARUDO
MMMMNFIFLFHLESFSATNLVACQGAGGY